MKRNWQWLALLLAMAMLQACATAYGKFGLTGGYSEKKIDSSHYVVAFDGNGNTDSDRVWYFWIYRCAQLTSFNRYSYFTLTKDATASPSSYVPGDDGARLQPAVLTQPGDGRAIQARTLIFIPMQITTWHAHGLVTMYPEPPPQDTVVIKAQVVLELLGPYVLSNGIKAPPERKTLAEAATFVRVPGAGLVNIHQYRLAHPGGLPLPPAPPRPPVRIHPPFLQAPAQKT